MITELLLNIFCTPLLLLLDVLPSITVTIPNNAFTSINSLFSTLGYIFPMSTYVIIIGLKTSFKLAKITIALVVRIKSFIPTMGA